MAASTTSHCRSARLPIPASSWSPAPLQTLQYLRAIFFTAAATGEKLTWKSRFKRHLTANMLSFLTTDGIIHTGVVFGYVGQPDESNLANGLQ